MLGFSAGIPYYLIFSTLSVWLSEAGASKAAVTYFSWAALGYSFKFVWAPIVDKLPLPVFTRIFGRRRGWLLLAQLMIISAIVAMGTINPESGLTLMAWASVALGFSAATQDIVVDSYRIEIAEKEEQAILSSSYVAGYRIGMIISGGGSLYLAEFLGSTSENYVYSAWQYTYWIMSACMLIGVITALIVREPTTEKGSNYPYSAEQYIRFFLVFLLSIAALITCYRLFPLEALTENLSESPLIDFVFTALRLMSSIFAGICVGFICSNLGLVDKVMVRESYVDPARDFFLRYKSVALWILLLVGFYRVSDIVMGVIANIFYLEMGYSKNEIATVTNVFGTIITIVGSFLGGLIALRVGVLRTLLLGAFLSAASNIVFAWLSVQSDPGINELTMAIIIDNLSQGIAIAAFIGWLSSLTSISFTATQYALFSSIMTLLPKLIGGYSGSIVEAIGYADFFILTALMGIPIIVLVIFIGKITENKELKSE